MSSIKIREIRPAARPKETPTVADFTLSSSEVAPLPDQQALVRNRFRSVGSYTRGRMDEGKLWVDLQGEFGIEAGDYFRAVKLKSKETVVVGIDQAVDTFIRLSAGKNNGKMVVIMA